MSEDIIVIAMDDRIAWHRNEIEAIEKMKAEHIARTGAKIRNKPGPQKGYKKKNGDNGSSEKIPGLTEALEKADKEAEEEVQ